jgi:hypothetical protein
MTFNTHATTDLAAAEGVLKANLGQLRCSTARPAPTQVAAVRAIEGLILNATKQQAGWGRLRLEALRELGNFLLRTPYLKGRPPKLSTVDTLPSLKKLGIEDRRIASRAMAVARISENVFLAYLTTDEPTEKGRLRHVFYESVPRSALVHRDACGDENYSESDSANVVPFEQPHSSASGKKHLALRATYKSEEWYTPPEIFEALGCRFDLDVASPGADVVPWIPAKHHFTTGDNALKRNWFGFVWCNPPYGREILPLWLEKFREHGNGIALVVDRTSTGWWQDLCGNADMILQVNKKIQFMPGDDQPSDNNALGSTLVAYGERAVKALMNAAAAGLGTLFKPIVPMVENHKTNSPTSRSLAPTTPCIRPFYRSASASRRSFRAAT